MEINIKDYLSDEEIKHIAEGEVASAIRQRLNSEKEVERILSNLSYRHVFDAIDKTLGTDAMRFIEEKTLKEIKKLNDFHIFRPGSVFEKKSEAYKHIDKAVEENAHIINEKVKESFETTTENQLHEITDKLHDTIIEKFIQTFNKED